MRCSSLHHSVSWSLFGFALTFTQLLQAQSPDVSSPPEAEEPEPSEDEDAPTPSVESEPSLREETARPEEEETSVNEASAQEEVVRDESSPNEVEAPPPLSEEERDRAVEPGAALEEEEILILGSTMSQASGSVHVIREAQLQRFEYDDPAAALQQTPGIYIRQEDGMGLRPNIGMRGANPDRSKKLTLMEDGVLVGPAPYSAPAGYFFPLMTRMTQLRVIKGPSAIAYGPQTVGGAIDFISRAIPLETAGGLDLGVGDYGYGKAHGHFGTSTEQFGFLIEGIRLQNTGFAELPTDADTGSVRNEWMMKASYVLDPQASTRNEFLFKFTYFDEASNETYLGQTDADFRVNPYRRYAASALDRMESHRTGLSLTHVLDMQERGMKLKTTVYRHDYKRAWSKLNRLGGASAASVLAHPEDPENIGYYGVLTGTIDSGSPSEMLYIGPNGRTFVSQGIQSVLDAQVRTGIFSHKIEAGVRLHHDQIRRKHTEDAYNMIEGQLVDAGQVMITTADSLAQSDTLAAHVTDAVHWKKLIVTPGLRAELIRSTVEDALTGEKREAFVTAFMPGAGAYYEVLPQLGVLAGVYRGFSPPAPASSASPEYSVNYEAGARFARGLMKLEAIGFYNDYQNMTDVCTMSSGCVDVDLDQQFDAGRARIYGVELYAGHEILLGGGFKLPGSVSYTYTRGQFLNTFDSQDPIYGRVVTGDEVPYIPENQANVTLGIEHTWGGLNASLYYIGRMREIAGSGPFEPGMTTDEQTWLDLSAFAKPLPWLNLYANLRNVTGEAYIGGRRPYGARVNAPRWFQVGVKAQF